jgi:hypothetical protein
MHSPKNPFRTGEHVRGAHFTDRAAEVDAVMRSLRDRGRMLVWGPRRMGKSTVLGVAADRVEREGGIVIAVDLSTLSGIAEAADRLLAAVSRIEPWQDRLAAWVKSLAPVVSLSADVAGRPRLSVTVASRPRTDAAEAALLEQVLDRIDAVASAEAAPVAVVLDEFQRLSELAGERAEWLLRNRMQEHRSTAYVCAGSKESLIREMIQPKRAFYKFFELLHVGPVDPAHLATWIDHRLAGGGVEARGVGALIVERVGPRTQDIMQTARTLWFGTQSSGRAGVTDVGHAVAEIVAAEEPSLRRTWEDLTVAQQKVLRALAAGAEQIHSTATRDQYALGASSSVAAALDALTGRGILIRDEAGVHFDNPFYRVWIERNALLEDRPNG